MSDELWQLYGEDGKPLVGKGASKQEVYKGLLHGASHVWIWREINSQKEILIQKRSSGKRTWASLLDISAAGHIDVGEKPINAAIRETKEELGVNLKPDQLNLIHIDRSNTTVPNGSIENEFCWVYIVKVKANETFKLDSYEVSSLTWKKLEDFEAEVKNPQKYKLYVPHSHTYYEILIDAIKSAS